MRVKSIAASILLLFFILFIVGCGGTSRPTNFFMLSPIIDAQAVSPQGEQVSVLVGPVTVPAYLDRDQIISRQPGVEITVFDFDHWAEPLSNNLKRIFITDLSLLLGSDEIYDFDRRNPITTEYQLEVDIYRFDFNKEGKAVLLAFWTILNDRGEVLRREKTFLEASSSGENLSSRIAAQNVVISALSRKIADVILSYKNNKKAEN